MVLIPSVADSHVIPDMITNIYLPYIEYAHQPRSLSMKLEGASRELVGSDIEFPEFDPWGFTKNADENKMAW